MRGVSKSRFLISKIDFRRQTKKNDVKNENLNVIHEGTKKCFVAISTPGGGLTDRFEVMISQLKDQYGGHCKYHLQLTLLANILKKKVIILMNTKNQSMSHHCLLLMP